MAQHPSGGTATRYAERLTVSWWMWPAALAAAGVLAAELHMGATGVRSWLPYLLLFPLAAAWLGYLGRLRVAVVDDELHIDDARIPLRWVAGVTPLDAAAKREILGPLAHPYAFVVQRPWVAPALLVRLDDPADPTPCCVVSTRHPARLAAALTAAAGRPVDTRAFTDLDLTALA